MRCVGARHLSASRDLNRRSGNSSALDGLGYELSATKAGGKRSRPQLGVVLEVEILTRAGMVHYGVTDVVPRRIAIHDFEATVVDLDSGHRLDTELRGGTIVDGASEQQGDHDASWLTVVETNGREERGVDRNVHDAAAVE